MIPQRRGILEVFPESSPLGPRAKKRKEKPLEMREALIRETFLPSYLCNNTIVRRKW